MPHQKETAESLIIAGLREVITAIIDERMNEAIPQRTILTVKEAAERYGLNKSTIYDWFGRGVLRKHSVAGRVYCYIEDFEGIKSRIRR